MMRRYILTPGYALRGWKLLPYAVQSLFYPKTEFFRENRFGTFTLPDRIWELEVIACFQAPASEELVFHPVYASGHIPEMLEYARSNAEQADIRLLEQVSAMKEPRILALTTCSADYTDSRTVLITLMKEGK